MKIEDLKPGMVIVTNQFLIADLYIDNRSELVFALRRPERIRETYKVRCDSSEEFRDSLNFELKPQKVKEIYDETNISVVPRQSDFIRDNKDIERARKYEHMMRRNIFSILMVFDQPHDQVTHNANTIDDIFNTRELIWVALDSDTFVYNMIYELEHKTIQKAYNDKGLKIEFVDNTEVK